MIKNKTILEVKEGERIYQFECYPDSPLGEVHDVLYKMKQHIVQMMIDAEKSKEEPKIVEAIAE